MKPITLHPASVLAGLALAGVLTVFASATQSVTRVQPFPKETVRIVGQVPADWWAYAQLYTSPDGLTVQSYTVPVDRYFVATFFDGSTLMMNGGNGPPMGAIRPQQPGPFFGIEDRNGTRVVFPPGAVLSLQPGSGSYSLWGYLEPVD